MSSPKRQQAIVIGGGIIGMSCATELARRGASVTIIEKSSIGHGCSYGNAGWLTPCFALPLPLPGLFWKSIQWLLNPESPLYIKPSLNPLLYRWLFWFMKSMNEKQARAATETLVALSHRSLEFYEDLDQRYPQRFGFQKKGLLMVGQTAKGLRAIHEELKMVEPFGVPGKMMSPEEIRKQEPALVGQLQGGVYFPNEAHVEPLALIETLRIEAQKYGTQIVDDCEFQDVESINGKISSIKTTKGNFSADVFILATGSWSKDLGKNLGIEIPILGGKGYSLVTPSLSAPPSHPIMFLERKVAITPRQNSIRIAGTFELVDQDFSITKRRVRALLKGAQEILSLPEDIDISQAWCGLRPCTPDGVPLVGFSSQYQNLMLACGHQMLGVQSGAGTGLLVADLIEGRSPWVNTKILDPGRFH